MPMTFSVTILILLIFFAGYIFGMVSESYKNRQVNMKLLAMIDELMGMIG